MSHRKYYIGLLSLLLTVPATGQQVVLRTGGGQTIQQRWSDVEQEAGARGNPYWIGFSFTRLMEEHAYFQRSEQWSFHTNDPTDSRRPSLVELITGEAPETSRLSAEEVVRRTAEIVLVDLGAIEREATLVERDIGFLARFDDAGLQKVWVGNVEFSPPLGTTPTYWLGASEGSAAIPLLESLLNNVKPNVRESVVTAIGSHSDADRVIPILARVLVTDPDDDVREEAACWLGKQNDGRVIPLLMRAVREDASMDVREEAVEGIGALSVDGAFEALVEIASSDSEANIREEAVEEIAERRTPQSAKTLERLALRDRSRKVRDEAIEGLSEMPSDLGVPALRHVLQTHVEIDARREAAEALSEFQSDEAVVALTDAVKHNAHTSVQMEALEALAELPGGKGIEPLIDVATNHPVRRVRLEAIELLGESGDPRAQAALERLIPTNS